MKITRTTEKQKMLCECFGQKSAGFIIDKCDCGYSGNCGTTKEGKPFCHGCGAVYPIPEEEVTPEEELVIFKRSFLEALDLLESFSKENTLRGRIEELIAKYRKEKKTHDEIRCALGKLVADGPLMQMVNRTVDLSNEIVVTTNRARDEVNALSKTNTEIFNLLNPYVTGDTTIGRVKNFIDKYNQESSSHITKKYNDVYYYLGEHTIGTTLMDRAENLVSKITALQLESANYLKRNVEAVHTRDVAISDNNKLLAEVIGLRSKVSELSRDLELSKKELSCIRQQKPKLEPNKFYISGRQSGKSVVEIIFCQGEKS